MGTAGGQEANGCTCQPPTNVIQEWTLGDKTPGPTETAPRGSGHFPGRLSSANAEGPAGGPPALTADGRPAQRCAIFPREPPAAGQRGRAGRTEDTFIYSRPAQGVPRSRGRCAPTGPAVTGDPAGL